MFLVRALLIAYTFVFTATIAQAQGLNIEVSPGKMTRIAAPGTQFVQTIRIGNYADTDRTFYLSTADFVVKSENGAPSFDVGEKDRRYALSTWMTLPTKEVTVPAGEVATVDVTVAVPEDALPGGHYGAVFVQTDDPAQLRAQEGSVIGSVGRIASLFLVTVPGDVTEKVSLVDFTPVQRIYWHQQPSITIRTMLRNEGTVHAIPTGALFVSGGIGYRGQSVIYNSQQGAVLPGAPPREIVETFTPRKHAFLPPMGRFTVRLVAKYGVSGQTLTGETSFYIIPVKFLISLFAASLVLLFILYRAFSSYRR